MTYRHFFGPLEIIPPVFFCSSLPVFYTGMKVTPRRKICQQCVCGPRPRWEAYSAPQTPLLDLRGLFLVEGRAGEKRGGKGKVREGRGKRDRRGGRKGEGTYRTGTSFPHFEP